MEMLGPAKRVKDLVLDLGFQEGRIISAEVIPLLARSRRSEHSG